MVPRFVWLVTSFGLATAAAASAQTVESVGVRAAGMGGAFVAVADDATAVYWNPAGLAAGAFVSGVVERSELDLGSVEMPVPGLPGERVLQLQDAGATLAAVGVPPVGVAYYRARATAFLGDLGGPPHEGVGRTLVTDNLAVNLLQSLADGVHVGASLRLVRGSAGAGIAGPDADSDELLDAAAAVERRSSWGFDVDAGLLVVRGRWRVGLAGRNLVAPDFETQIPRDALSLSRQARAGVAFVPRGGTTLAVDADLTRTETSVGDRRHVALGAEQAIGARCLVRGGVRLNTLDEARPAGAAGASLAVTPSIWVDAQVTRGARDAERGWGVGLRFAY